MATYDEIAESYDLWEEFVDPSGLMSEEEFEAMSMDERIAFIVGCFGEEETPEADE